jgi:TolA-binding protein
VLKPEPTHEARLNAAVERAREVLSYDAPRVALREEVLRALNHAERPPESKSASRLWQLRLALAASVLLVASAGWFSWHGADSTASTRQLDFPGCTLEADVATEIALVTQDTRQLTLRQGLGKAVYEVLPDQQRRVQVVSGNVLVTVKGTRFQVSNSGASTSVAVERGVVEVLTPTQSRILSANEELTVENSLATETHPLLLAELSSAPPPVSSEAKELLAMEQTSPPVASEVPNTTDKRATSGNGANAREQDSDPVQILVQRSDAARAEGNHNESIRLLRELLRTVPQDARVPSWHFTLARALRSNNQHTAAAQAFESCHRSAPRGALAHDALAEAALAYRTAGQGDHARRAADQYLAIYPDGIYAAKMRQLSR